MSNYPDFNCLRITPLEGQIVELQLHRPQSRNALSWELMRELKAALHLLDQDNRVRVIILSGAGKSFCAGLDLLDQNNTDSLRDTIGEIKAGSRAGMRAQEYMADIALLMRRIQQPIIAAVHGHAYGGGLALALACDLRIAASTARFCSQFIRLGVSGCDFGVSYTLPRLIGASRAHDMMLTARVVDAERAEQWGLVTRLTSDVALTEEARALARSLTEFSPYGVISTKQAMWENLNAQSLQQALQLENRNQILNGLSGDVEEAAAAFFEKRPPRFDD
ncbi:MAG: enoyl-CoA hydratase [Spongiibacter sp.]|uniref:enoyl-CoA hydratase/isomerase family protein n=1 Tax=Spongiibacter sp. TaxID=2024860 RepID=UPI000C09FF23|nr:enoyl-CoA hydratase/isomerase family protein [Spongiibacter sp.]MAK45009.1 enoyl-CoA hydratase [Spongiibacter sp.]|tara:strand:+ start:673 stop:1506 length:834 start_codon:yes stop_codon:yes gene_type:complete